MNATQQSQYAKALIRAHKAQLTVGTASTHDGQTAYIVSSQSEPNRYHVVTVTGADLHCDCTAAKRGMYCCHRAAVSERIATERAAVATEEAAHVAWFERATDVRALRGQLRDLNADIDSLYQTRNAIWDRDENDPRIAAIQADITKFETIRDALIERIHRATRAA